MPKSKYVTITLTQHEAELVRDEIEMASIDGNTDRRRRADLARAHDKLTAAYVCGHNTGPTGSAPTTSLIGRMAAALQTMLDHDDGTGDTPIFTEKARTTAEELIATVQGKGGRA